MDNICTNYTQLICPYHFQTLSIKIPVRVRYNLNSKAVVSLISYIAYFMQIQVILWLGEPCRERTQMGQYRSVQGYSNTIGHKYIKKYFP